MASPRFLVRSSFTWMMLFRSVPMYGANSFSRTYSWNTLSSQISARLALETVVSATGYLLRILDSGVGPSKTGFVEALPAADWAFARLGGGTGAAGLVATGALWA